jgi:pimeloyl-ACP methyl ester carboxylesterase
MCGGTQSKMAEPEVIETLIDVMSNMGKPDPATWVERQLPLLFAPDWVAANPRIRDVLTMMVPLLPPTPPETAQHALAGIYNWGTYERLPKIEAPTLVIHGDRDVIIPVENAYILAERIAGAKLHIIKGAGHGYPAQDPVLVHRAITDFLRSR